MNVKKVLAVLILAVLIIPAVFAQGEGEATTEPVVLMHDKSGSPNYQPYFEQMAEVIREETGVEMEPTSYPSTDAYMAQVRSSMLTKEAPGLFTWWSTYRMKGMIDNGVLADTSDLWAAHEGEFPQGLVDAFTFDGVQYGFPYSVEYWPIWYNKETFSQLGLEEPSTWDEFIHVCDTLVENDVTPLLTTVEGRWPTFIIFEEMIIGQDPQLYVDLCEGDVKYSDPRVVEAFELWGDMIEKAYFTEPGTDVWAGGARDFNQGKVAMAPFGTWYMDTLTSNGVPEENIGAFILPSHNPDAGKNVITEISPLLISKNTKNLADAKAAADYWMTPEGNETFAEYVTFYPANSKSGTSFLPPVKTKIADTINQENYNVLNRYWEATPTPICEAAVDQFAKFMIDPSSLDEVIAELDRVADNYWDNE
ncbi:MAG: ABC transporter substrate-binding protein [Spirochaetales bacterium]|nr:ABC transporter substrate-binding protein [Spirochaetales bacterium]